MPVTGAVHSINSSHFAPVMFSLIRGNKILSEGAIPGLDKLRKTVALPGRTEKSAIRYIAERANHSIDSSLKSRGCPNRSCFVKIDLGATDRHCTCPQLACAMQPYEVWLINR